MKTLLSTYVKNNEFGLKAKKSFKAPLSAIYIEEDFNVRPIDQNHVENLRQSYLRGDDVPAINVKVTEKGLQVVDGHHRFLAAQLAELDFIDIEDCKGAATIYMLKRGHNLEFTPLDYAEGFKRLRDEDGMTVAEIAAEFNKTGVEVYNYLSLASANDRIKQLLRDKLITMQQALLMVKEYRGLQDEMTDQDVEVALEDAKKEIKKKSFSVKNAKLLVKILLGSNLNTDEEEITIKVPREMRLEILDLIGKFQEQQ